MRESWRCCVDRSQQGVNGSENADNERNGTCSMSVRHAVRRGAAQEIGVHNQHWSEQRVNRDWEAWERL